MSSADDTSHEDRPADDGERDYALVALGGLFLVFLMLLQEDFGWWAVIPPLAGTLGVLTAWGVGPAVVLFFVLVLFAARNLPPLIGVPNFVLGLPSWYRPPGSSLADAALAAGLLAYVAGHARLLTLRHWAVPPDPRRAKPPRDARLRGRWFLPAKETRRSARHVRTGELLGLLGSIPIFLVFAGLIWINVEGSTERDRLGFPPPVRQALTLVWLGGFVLAVGWAAGAYLGRAKGGRAAALTYLQDQLWDATRGEQRQITRTVVRGRLRRQKQEEGS